MAAWMSDLAIKTCVPCGGGVPPLKGEELAALEKQVNGWNVIEQHHITKAFKFPDFSEGLNFVNSYRETKQSLLIPKAGIHCTAGSTVSLNFHSSNYLKMHRLRGILKQSGARNFW
jgi:hypothetical protein